MRRTCHTGPIDTLRIVVIDDHPLVRDGLVRVACELDGAEVLASADSIESALDLEASDVDVCTLDLSLPGAGGLESIGALRSKWPTVRVLVVTVHSEHTHLDACRRHGATGFVSKSATPTQIRHAIAEVAAGRPHFPGAAIMSDDRQRLELSTRERQLLRGLARGERITDISRQLQVSVKTASAHKMRLQRKLGASNTAQIVTIARAQGLLP